MGMGMVGWWAGGQSWWGTASVETLDTERCGRTLKDGFSLVVSHGAPLYGVVLGSIRSSQQGSNMRTVKRNESSGQSYIFCRLIFENDIRKTGALEENKHLCIGKRVSCLRQ